MRISRRSALGRLTAIVLATPVIGSFIGSESAHAAPSTPVRLPRVPPGTQISPNAWIPEGATDIEARWRHNGIAYSRWIEPFPGKVVIGGPPSPLVSLGETYSTTRGYLREPLLVFFDMTMHSVRHYAYCDHAINVRYIGEMATQPVRVVRVDCSQPHPRSRYWSPDKILGHDMWFPAYMGAPWDTLWENRLVPASWAGIRYDRGGIALPRFTYKQWDQEFAPNCWCGAPPPVSL